MIRPPWLLPCLMLLLCFALPATTRGQHTAPGFTVSELGRPTAPLSSGWQFHAGDDPQWADPAFDTANWEPIAVDRGWGAQSHFSYEGFGWYRLRLTVTESASGLSDLAIYLPKVSDAYEVYWQGVQVGSYGRMPPHASWPILPQPQVFGLGKPGSGVLAIRVWKAPLGSFDTGLDGGLTQPPILGSNAALQLLRGTWNFANLRAMQPAIALALIYIAVCLGMLGIWLQHREEPVFLWFSLLAAAGILHGNWWHGLLNFSAIQDALFATFLVQPLADISTWFVLISLLRLRGNVTLVRWTKRLVLLELGLCLCDGIALLCWAPGWPQWVDGIISEVILLPELFPVVLVLLALIRRQRLPVDVWLVAAFALLVDLDEEVGAFLSQGNRFTHWVFWRYLLEPVSTVGGVVISLPQTAELLLLLSLIAAVIRYAVQENRRERARANEFHSAQELQRVLIPEDLPYILGYEVTSAYRPAQEVGGDFFQLIPQGGGSALLVLGDVSGKGLPAAMAVSLIVGTIRTLAEQLPSPAEMLAGINRRLTGKLHGGFATCLVVFLDADGSLLLASAGHPGPFINGRELAVSPSLPLGLSLEAEFEETSAVLQTGQHLVLFSDGLLEARNDQGELFGFDRVGHLAESCLSAGEMADVATRFGQEDDITIVTVTRLRVGAEPRSSLTAPALLPRRPEAA